MLFQHPQLLSSRVHANSNTRLVNPDPSTENNYDAPSQHIILPARPENVAASNTHHQQQQTVTATAAREQQQHPTTANNAGDKYGSKIPSVNRMGGLDPADIENLFDNRKIAFVAPVTESEILVETTEANPTSTIQPFDEEEFTSNLKFQLNVEEQQQLAVVPVTTNAPEEFDDSKINDDNKLVAPQTDKDSYNNLTTEKSAESSTVDVGVESVQNVLTANESQPLSEELTTTVQPNLASADAQTSAVVVTLNSVSEKDLDADDYRATTLASPTTDPAAHFLELPDVSPTEESTEFSSSTNKAIAVSSSSDLVDDSTQSNFVTGLETTTFIPDISSLQSTGSDNNGLLDELTDLKATPIPDVFSSPIVESLDFNVIADSNSFSSGIIISDGNATANIQVSSFAESSSAPGNDSQLLTPTASSAVTSTTSSYTETTPSASTTTQPIIKTTDSVISLIAYSEGKRTLYGNDERHCIF